MLLKGQTMARIASKAGETRIVDLRASLRAAKEKSRFDKAPPQPKKRPKGESVDERAERAERQAQIQHTTSLLTGGNSRKPYVRVGERSQKNRSIVGLLFQLVFVMAAAVGIACAIDPTLVPPELAAKGHALLDQGYELIKPYL